MSEPPADRPFWRDATLVLLAAQALAVAIWLLPASVHVVRWPETGPHRLALLAPTWQLLALSIVAAAVAAVVVWWVRDRQMETTTRVRQAALPLTLLWAWAVPYLPWLPDRWPLLLVLSGPLRWAIAGMAVVLILRSGTSLAPRLSRVLETGRGGIFIASLAIYAGVGLYSARVLPPGGDEPHYLIITESLLKDADLKIENNHRQRDYLAFWSGELRPDFFERGKDGEIYSVHAPGLPALVLPAYAVAGRSGVVAFIALLAALAALAVFDVADVLAGRRAAVLAWAACCLTVPFVPYAWMIFPEMPGALVVAWAVRWLTTDAPQRPGVWLLRGAALATLPWLHTKFVVFLTIFAAALVVRLLRQPRHALAFAAPIALSGVLWLYSFYAIYGAFNPEAPYGDYSDYSRLYVLTRNIPHGILGIFFDQKFGLLFYAPIYLAAIGGAWLMLRDDRMRFPGVVLLLAVGAFVGSTARLYMFWGGSSAPARFLVPLLPCLAPLVAVALARTRGAAGRAAIGSWIAVSLGIAAVGIMSPERLTLFSDPHGRSRLLELIEAASPLSLVIPTFTEPTWAAEIPSFARWIGAAGAVAAVVVIAARAAVWQPFALAGLAGASLLIAGAIVSAHPPGEIRAATARRGALEVLAHFDGSRFRTLDYQTLGRASAEHFRELSTVVFEPRPPDIRAAGYSTAPVTLPPGAYDAVVSFADPGGRSGDVQLLGLPSTTFGRASGALANPTRIPFELPATIRRFVIRVGGPAAAAVHRVEMIPRSVVSPGDRIDANVRLVENLPGRPGAYLVYTDQHAYPENGVYWSRGTAETRVFVAPADATRMTLTLSTGPMTGRVALAVAGATREVAMKGGQIEAVSFDVPSGQRLVPVNVRSSVMFRPAEIEKSSTDMRGLGCQVRITLE